MTATPLTALQLKQLIADLNPNRVAHRGKNGGSSGPQLSYLEAWDVRTALIRIFGFGGFSYESETRILKIEEGIASRSNANATNFRVTAMSTVKLYIPQLDVYYQESAVSSQAQPDPGECADFAVKTAESDALKRCAVNLGTQFGLSLYNKGAQMDVVKQTREPYQAAIITRLAQGETAASIDEDLRKETGLRGQPVDVQEPTDSEFQHGYDPDHGDTGLEGGGDANAGPSGPEGENEQPMFQREVDPARASSARDSLREGFNRTRSDA